MGYTVAYVTTQPDGSYEMTVRTLDDGGDPLGTEQTGDPKVAARETAEWGCRGTTLENCLHPLFSGRVPTGWKSRPKSRHRERMDVYLDKVLI